MTVTRRKFLPAAAAATVAASTLAAPAIAQTEPTIKWRLTASYPKSLDTLFGAVNTIAKTVSDLTDGKFELQPFAAGEIVPGLQVLDAVSNNTVECGFTYMGYYIGKNPAAIFDASLPFGLTPRQHAAWLMFGGGRQLVDELYDGFGVVAITAGNTGGQMFGWFRKELKTPKDFEGLKMRTAGFGAQGDGEARCRGAADRRRRHLSCARARHDRRLRMGRPVRRREARLQQEDRQKYCTTRRA